MSSIVNGYLAFKIDGKLVYEHTLIAERALRRKLPNLAEVHHVDEDRLNNQGTNLVICPSREYHALLHQRSRALAISGHADWIKCSYCSVYDSKDSMYFSNGRGGWHRSCKNEYQRTQRRIRSLQRNTKRV